MLFPMAKIQQKSSECLIIPIELINKGAVPYCDSSDDKSTGVSPCDTLFSFMLYNYIVCDVCGLSSPWFLYLVVLYITPTFMQVLIMQGIQQNKKRFAFYVKNKNTWHVESIYVL